MSIEISGRLRVSALLWVCTLSFTSPLCADPKQEPLWEVGIGAGAVAFSNYTGSDRILVYPIPFPYFVYRGTFLRSDRDGLRGMFVNNRVIEFNLSGDASAPVTSS